MIYFKKFEANARKPEELDYILFGSRREQFVAHLITAKPDFDQVLGVDVADDQLRSAVANNPQPVQIEIPGMPNDRPVSDTAPLRAIAMQEIGKPTAILNDPHQYYLEFCDLSH